MIPFSLPYHLAFAAVLADNYSYAKTQFRQKKALTFVSEFSSFFSKFYTVHFNTSTTKMEALSLLENYIYT